MSEMRLLVTGGSGFIGTNVMQHYIDKGIPLMNVDWNPPLNTGQSTYWKECDILDSERFSTIAKEFGPTHVIHLAARADCEEEEDMRGYLQNHEGTRVVLEVLKTIPSMEHVIVTSTQFVCEAGYQPKHDTDYKPYTMYGESKKLTEDVTRAADLPFAWTIIRPTTIWGPYSLRYRDITFRVMKKGLYFHPSKKNVIRSYGYVGNVVWQIDRMLTLPREQMKDKVFYVGDQPFDLITWVDAIARELTGKPVRIIPTWLVRLIALGGDVLTALRLPFPITSSRYRSMISDYITPMDRTIEALGEAPYGMEEGVKEFISWYNNGSEKIIAHTLKDIRQLEAA